MLAFVRPVVFNLFNKDDDDDDNNNHTYITKQQNVPKF